MIGPLYSKRLPAGEATEVETLDHEIQITNIALEGTAPGRTVVKLHYLQFDPLAAGSDDESFDEDDLVDDFDEEDDEDEEMDRSASKLSANGKAAAAAAAAELDGEDDDDDEDEDDDEISEDDDELAMPPREEATVILCSLYPEKLEQVSLNILLPADDAYEFIVEGPNAVHIAGNLVAQVEPRGGAYDSDMSYDSDEELDSDLADSEGGLYDPETGLPIDDSELDDLEDEEDDEDDEEREIKDASPAKAKGKAAGKASPAAAAASLPAADVKAAAADASMEVDGAGADPLAGLSKNQKKKALKKAKAEAAAAGGVQAVTGTKTETVTVAKDGKKTAETKSKAEVTVAPADGGKDVKATAKKASKKTTLPSGVVLEDIKAGDGAAAKAGSKCTMRYIGKLKETGAVFDSNTKGKPFAFKLGKGEVIKGWDEGIVGMRPGGERRLTIPPSQAYGKTGAPPQIPGNAALVFEVKLLSC